MAEGSLAIRRLRTGDADRLRELMIAAKGHWGYEPEWVRQWVDEPGNFTLEQAAGAEVAVAELDGRIVGWAQWLPRGAVAWLEDLWIDPGAMGAGVGRALFDWSRKRAREVGCRRLEWEAEPNAVGFYERLGGRYLRESEHFEHGRALPVMGIDVLT